MPQSDVYRPLVRDGVMNTIIGSSNVYIDAAEAVMEAMHFAHVYNDDMYNGEISWTDVQLMQHTREQLRILSGTINRPGAEPFYIEIEKLPSKESLTIANKSQVTDEFRQQNTEIAIHFRNVLEDSDQTQDIFFH
ncbi:hypothetical protein [Pontibacillus litoralis]|uniref:Uncharacterized protein n=1 Tax=Pontibacillus litoralis JSM 072002 TaxID=1385512 RepID=A0A0A5HMR3_9BACI|nr:hypothetical protein [Pontibacillus litoralis]KGX84907.1 hypothetical protein N784_11530 [Pontibacillus litoralis JSM 072002]